MNYQKLKEAEASFLLQFPGGFSDPGMAPIKKKHDIDKLSEFTQQTLTRANFNRPEFIMESLVKIIGRSSMVSRFEKPKFRDFAKSLNSHEKQAFTDAFEKRLYGRKKRQGFEEILGFLSHYGVAKWPIVTAVPFYFAPQKEAFVKPTTAKGIIAYLEIAGLEYKPAPSWAFYKGYLDMLGAIRKEVSPSLSANNAALSGFMMGSI